MKFSKQLNVEVVASSAADVAVAAEGGADRVELCAALSTGGLSPTAAAVRAACGEGLPVRVLVRPRAGNFCYDLHERALIVAEAQDAIEAGAERAVVGGLTAAGGVDVQLIAALLDALPAELLVFHRCFDVCDNPANALDELRVQGIVELLTSGGAQRAIKGLIGLEAAVRAGFEVVAGGGVRPEDVAALHQAGVRSFHASCRRIEKEPPGLFSASRSYVDLESVKSLVAAVAELEKGRGELPRPDTIP